MNFEKVERDFVSRTLAVLKQYRQHVRPQVGSREGYEVTLLLNCLLGLIVVPFEHVKRNQKVARNQRLGEYSALCAYTQTPISKLSGEWGLEKLRITKFNENGKPIPSDEVSLWKIVTMFRNGMAHFQFGDGRADRRSLGLSVEYQTSENDPLESSIQYVHVANKHRSAKYSVEFEASISVADLRTFSTKFAEAFLAEFGSLPRYPKPPVPAITGELAK